MSSVVIGTTAAGPSKKATFGRPSFRSIIRKTQGERAILASCEARQQAALLTGDIDGMQQALSEENAGHQETLRRHINGVRTNVAVDPVAAQAHHEHINANFASHPTPLAIITVAASSSSAAAAAAAPPAPADTAQTQAETRYNMAVPTASDEILEQRVSVIQGSSTSTSTSVQASVETGHRSTGSTDTVRPRNLLVEVNRLHTRMDGVEERLDNVEGRMDRLEGRMDRLEGRMDRLEGRMDNLEGRMDNLEGRMGKLEDRVEKLEKTVESNHEKTTRMLSAIMRKMDIQDSDI